MLNVAGILKVDDARAGYCYVAGRLRLWVYEDDDGLGLRGVGIRGETFRFTPEQCGMICIPNLFRSPARDEKPSAEPATDAKSPGD